MKAIHFAVSIFLVTLLSFSNNVSSSGVELNTVQDVDTVPKKSRYLDLTTGETIDIWYDKTGRRTLNKRTGASVEFYVNTATNDTVLGRGRFVINDYIVRGTDGKWQLNDRKVVLEGDQLKARTGDKEFKVDGDDGTIKSKKKQKND